MKKKNSAARYASSAVLRTVLIVLAAILLIKAGQQAYGFGYQVFAQTPMSAAPGKNVSVTISEDMGASEIGKLLQAKGLIRDSGVFRVQMALSSYGDELRPGTYILNTSQTADEMLEILAGQVQEETEEW